MKTDAKTMGSRLWIGCMAAALIAALGIFFLLLYLEKQTLADYEKETVYVADKKIPEGIKITEDNFVEYMVPVELDKSVVAATSVRQPRQVWDSVAKEDVEEGVFVTDGMFEPYQEILADMEQPVIAGFKADDLYQVAGGVLRAGDRIHIYTVSEDKRAGLVWESVYVEQVFDGAGNAISAEDRTALAQRMNVYMDAADVEYFYTELARGALRVVKVCD